MARKLLILNGLAIIGVVLNHSASFGFIAMFWWAHRYLPVSSPNFDQMGNAAYYGLRFIEQLVAFSVPTFLFVSGFFIAFVAGKTPADIWRIARTRIGVLVIPYLIWSVVTIAGRIILGENFALGELIRLVIFGQAAEHFYFIPLLLQLYLLSPWLIPAARKSWQGLLVGAALVQLLAQGVHYLVVLWIDTPAVSVLADLSPSWLFTSKVFWFCLGIVASLRLQPMMKWLGRAKWALLVAWAVFLLLGMIEWETLLARSGQVWIAYFDTVLDGLYAGAFILLFLGFENLTLPYSRQISDLGTKSYGIYLIHGLALTFTAKAVYQLVPAVLGYQIVFQPILVAAGLGIPLVLMALIKKSPVKKYYTYLFG